MNISDMDNLLWLATDIGQVLLLAIVVVRSLHRTFPMFSAYILWQLISDLLLFLTITASHSFLGHHYASIYFSLNLVTYLFELGILLEIGAHVLHPAQKVLPRGAIYFLLGAALTLGISYFFFVERLKLTANLRLFLVMDTAAAILCLATFLLIAGFSQILGLSWKNHVLQLATGLAFYSVVDLIVELMQSHLHAGPSYAEQYHIWGQLQVIGYLCTLSFWCYAFVKKEAPRQEFSPQMQKILVLLSGGAKRQRAVFARSREH